MINKKTMIEFLENDRIITSEEVLRILSENYPDHIIQDSGNSISIWTKKTWGSNCELAGPSYGISKMSYAGYPENNYFTGMLGCQLSGALYNNWAKKQQRTVKEKRELESLSLIDSLDILYA